MAIFDPLQNRHPLTDRQTICHRWLRRWLLQLCQIWYTSVHGALLGKWVKYNWFFFIFMPLFTGTHLYSSDASTGFRAWWLKRRGLAQGCAFLGFVDIAPHLGVKSPKKNPIFGAWIGVFKPNSWNRKHAYYQNYCIDSNQILHSDKYHQMPFVGGPNTHNKSNMADGRHRGKIEKSPYFGCDLTDFDQIWHGDAVRSSWAVRLLNILNFKNPRWRRPPSWKIEKSPYVGRTLINFDQIWLGNTVQPSW